MTVEKKIKQSDGGPRKDGRLAASRRVPNLFVLRGVRLFLACKISALVSAGFCAAGLRVCGN